MGIIHRVISTHIVNKAGFSNKQGKTVRSLLFCVSAAPSIYISIFTCCSWKVRLAKIHGVVTPLPALKLHLKAPPSATASPWGLNKGKRSLPYKPFLRYELKAPYRDGTTHVFFDPLDFIGKLAALILPPRINLTRFFGVFAPNSDLWAQVTASKRGKNSPTLKCTCRRG
jgi:hypothetical protein